MLLCACFLSLRIMFLRFIHVLICVSVVSLLLRIVPLYACVRAKSLQLCPTLRPYEREPDGQGYWSGLPFPSPGYLSEPGVEPTSLMSPALAGRFLTTTAAWEAHAIVKITGFIHPFSCE